MFELIKESKNLVELKDALNEIREYILDLDADGRIAEDSRLEKILEDLPSFGGDAVDDGEAYSWDQDEVLYYGDNGWYLSERDDD
jgi:hypothetical protein